MTEGYNSDSRYMASGGGGGIWPKSTEGIYLNYFYLHIIYIKSKRYNLYSYLAVCRSRLSHMESFTVQLQKSNLVYNEYDVRPRSIIFIIFEN